MIFLTRCLTVALQLLALSDGAVFLSDYAPPMLAFFTHKAGFPPHEQEVKSGLFTHPLVAIRAADNLPTTAPHCSYRKLLI